MKDTCMKLHVVGLGLAIGVVWALGLLILGLLGVWLDYGTFFINMTGSIYYGYEATYTGTLLGVVWGFIDGFVTGVILAWLYNHFAKRCCEKTD